MQRFKIIIFILFIFVDFSIAQKSLLRSGPMLGYGEMREVMLWVQVNEKAKIHFEYWKTSNSKVKFKSKSIEASEEKYFTTQIALTNLLPGTNYQYELFINNKKINYPYPLKFKTQSLWQFRTVPPDFSVAFGSCLYINEAEFDRPQPYGSTPTVLKSITNKKPDLMLWLGDNTYYREPDFFSASGMNYRYSHTREIPELQELLSSTHNYAIWDDHDYGPNDADRSYKMRNEALEVFKNFWTGQNFGTDETPGVFYRFQFNDAEFFMLDDRFHRSPNNAPNDESKTMFGKSQLQWLKDCLLNSSQPFKIIANGNQMLNEYCEHETFTKFTAEYRDLISFIKQNKISGVIFLSGDRHHTELIQQKDSTFYTLYDFTSSALSAGLGNPVKEYGNPLRVDSTLVFDKHNFGILKFSGKRNSRKLEMSCIDKDGATRWKFEISETDLKIKK